MMKNTLLMLCLGLPASGFAQFAFTNASNLLPGSAHASEHPIAIMDVNGDHKDDLVILEGGDEPYVYFQNNPGAVFTQYVYPNTIAAGNAWGMCGGDVDEDGFNDFIFGGSYDGLHILRTDGTSSTYIDTSLSTSIFLQGINFADIDHDGHLDIFACHDDGPSRVLLGDGMGGFTPNSTHLDTDLPNGSDNSGNYGSVFTDIDNDGDIDLYVAKCRQGVSDPNDYRRINVLFENDGNGFYTETADNWGIASGEQSWSADFADVDNDGDMDLFIGQHSSGSELFLNDGMGSFTDVTTSSGMSNLSVSYVIQSVFEDFDNDGWIDLLVSGAGSFEFMRNNGDGTFTSVGQADIDLDVNSFSLGDLNADGFTDIYATPHGYGSWGSFENDTVYTNDGNNNNYLTISTEGTVSNPNGIGARIEIHGPWGVQVREVRSGMSYGIQTSLNAHFGIGTETTIPLVKVIWPSGIVDGYTDVTPNQHLHIVEGTTVGITGPALGKVLIYPTIAQDQIVVQAPEWDQNEVAQIYDMSGKKIREVQLTHLNTPVDVSGLNSGRYQLVIVRESGATYNGTFMVVR